MLRLHERICPEVHWGGVVYQNVPETIAIGRDVWKGIPIKIEMDLSEHRCQDYAHDMQELDCWGIPTFLLMCCSCAGIAENPFWFTPIQRQRHRESEPRA